MKKMTEKQIDWAETLLSIALVIGFAAIVVFDIFKIVKLIKRIIGSFSCGCDECCCIEADSEE